MADEFRPRIPNKAIPLCGIYLVNLAVRYVDELKAALRQAGDGLVGCLLVIDGPTKTGTKAPTIGSGISVFEPRPTCTVIRKSLLAGCEGFDLNSENIVERPNEKVLIRRAAAWRIKPVGLNRWIQSATLWDL